MAILKCKMCGGDLNITADEKIIECEYCGSTQTIPDGSDEKKTNLFNRANRLRMDNEFDKAAGVYESIVSEFPEEAEGYWGLVLCSYGIEYVDDAKTGKKIPTCHRTLASSVMDDDNFTQACENADVIARGVYREEAKTIDKLQQQIIAVVENEEPYDVFICYKETDDITKQRTEDSLIAQDIYTELIKEGYKVFFSRVTLRDKAGTEYEPYIYAALKSAKIMLAIGTKFDYYDAVWVKNEWSRYISMMADDSSKHLIPCFKNLDAYDIPKEFKNLQALDMGEVTFFKNLTDNVERFIPKQKTELIKAVEPALNGNDATIETLMKRAFMFLEDGNWQNADQYCEKVLDIDPECVEAYLCKLLSELKISKQEDLVKCHKSFEQNPNYKKLLKFGNDNLIKELTEYLDQIKYRNNMETYSLACKLMEMNLESAYIEAIKFFEKISDFKDSKEQIKRCEELIKKLSENLLQKSILLRKICSMNRMYATLSAGSKHTVGLKSDGTVVSVGSNKDGQCNVKGWTEIVAISARGGGIVGLKADGTAVAVGINDTEQHNVNNWSDIISVSTNSAHTVGLKADGTVVAVGSNNTNQCNVKGWTEIVAISAGGMHTVGLKSDGTVVAVGRNIEHQCDVNDWSDIILISAGFEHTVGLKSDGTVVAVGNNFFGACDVKDWTDIVAISAGGMYTVGLKSNGTVIAVGNNRHEQCNVKDWTNIVAISAGFEHTVGLKAEGSVVAVGSNEDGQCNVGDWKDIFVLPKLNNMDDLVSFEKAQAIKKQEYIENATLRTRAEQRKKAEKTKLMSQYRSLGKCQYCGGTFKGLFTKTCTKCGKKKDY